MSFRIGLNIVRHNLRRNISNSLSMRSVRQYNTENNTQKENLGDRLLRYYFVMGTFYGVPVGSWIFLTKQAKISRDDSVFGVCIDTLQNLFYGVIFGGLATLWWPVIAGTYYYRKYNPSSPSESSESLESPKSQKPS
jgi:hypothetical protein